MESEQLLRSFADRMNLGDLWPEEDGRYQLTYDDLTVNLVPENREIMVLSGIIGLVPQDEREAEEHLKELLKLNLARMREQKEVVGLDRETGEITLHRRVSTGDLTVGDFEEIMEEFVNAVEYWVGRAKEVRAPRSTLFPGIFP